MKQLNKEEGAFYQKALLFAADAHKEQYREYSGEPYILHPIDVAEILREQDREVHIIAAGVLHDVVEDTEYNYNDIKNLFGVEVADIVNGVTKLPFVKNSNQAFAFWTNVLKLREASEESQDVKCADIISNCRSVRSPNFDITLEYMAKKSITLDNLFRADCVLVSRAREAISEMVSGYSREFNAAKHYLEKQYPS